MTSIPNRDCLHLGIPVPSVEAVAFRPEVTLFQFVVVALLEHGGPMTVEEVAARLDRAALPARRARPDLAVAVKKAWHGQPPLVRDGDARLALDVLSSEFRHIELKSANSWRTRARAAAPCCTSCLRDNPGAPLP